MTGLILVDKPQGYTSFDVAAKLRRACNTKKIGHTGTLDPMATGVLPVLTGGATRLASLIPDHDKSYVAEIKLGLQTDTLDITGRVIKEEKTGVTREAFENALSGFRGEILQTPPMFSAIKKQGVKLYTLARQGIEVEVAPREVSIYDLTLTAADEANQCFTIAVSCSKGTYIRKLAEDIGAVLGCPAALSALRRVKACGFTIDQCAGLEQIIENPGQYCLPPDTAVAAYPEITVTSAQAVRFQNGGALFLDRLSGLSENAGLIRVYGNGCFLGVGETDYAAGLLKIKCVMPPEI